MGGEIYQKGIALLKEKIVIESHQREPSGDWLNIMVENYGTEAMEEFLKWRISQECKE